MKNILLCSLKYDTNLGDLIINNSVKGIIEDILKDEEIEYKIDEIDLSGRKYFKTKYEIKTTPKMLFNRLLLNIIRVLRFIARKIKLKKIFNWLDGIIWNFTDKKEIFKQIYIDKIKNADMIIFAGGGLIKYNYLYTYSAIDFITRYAEKYNKPVYFNSVGVEGYDSSNYKCRILKNAINRNNIKMISTRDDLETLKKYIDNENIILRRVADPAVYSSMVYNISKKKNSDVIGLCVCRDNLFIDSGINYTRNDLMKLWKEIIRVLDSKGIKWKIYTNGSIADNEFAYKLLSELGIEENSQKFELPKDDKQLIEIISGFKGVIATRLHSCIISFSLNVPVVGLVWNNKLKHFGNAIGYSERFIECKNFIAEDIVEKLLTAIDEEYLRTDKSYKKSVYDAICFSIENYLK